MQYSNSFYECNEHAFTLYISHVHKNKAPDILFEINKKYACTIIQFYMNTLFNL